MMMRGIEKQNSSTVTSAMVGVFQKRRRAEFCRLSGRAGTRRCERRSEILLVFQLFAWLISAGDGPFSWGAGSTRTAPIMPRPNAEDMAMERKSSDNGGITEIHTYSYARIRHKAIPCRNVNRVAQCRLFPSHASRRYHDEMQLMHVKGVRLPGTIFDCPVFHVPLMYSDGRLLAVRIKQNGHVAVLGNKELCRALRIAWIDQLFRKKELAFPCRSDC